MFSYFLKWNKKFFSFKKKMKLGENSHEFISRGSRFCGIELRSIPHRTIQLIEKFSHQFGNFRLERLIERSKINPFDRRLILVASRLNHSEKLAGLNGKIDPHSIGESAFRSHGSFGGISLRSIASIYYDWATPNVIISPKASRPLDYLISVNEFISKKHLLKTHQKILIAFSGGQDSMVLFFIIIQLKKQWNWTVNLIWCNHLWQKDSFYLMFHILKVSLIFSTKTFCFISISSIFSENKARNWRYQIFLRASYYYNLTTILTGHTLTDKVETLLFNLTRGCGIDGFYSLNKSSFITLTKYKYIFPSLIFFKILTPMAQRAILPKIKKTQKFNYWIDRAKLDPHDWVYFGKENKSVLPSTLHFKKYCTKNIKRIPYNYLLMQSVFQSHLLVKKRRFAHLWKKSYPHFWQSRFVLPSKLIEEQSAQFPQQFVQSEAPPLSEVILGNLASLGRSRFARSDWLQKVKQENEFINPKNILKWENRSWGSSDARSHTSNWGNLASLDLSLTTKKVVISGSWENFASYNWSFKSKKTVSVCRIPSQRVYHSMMLYRFARFSRIAIPTIHLTLKYAQLRESQFPQFFPTFEQLSETRFPQTQSLNYLNKVLVRKSSKTWGISLRSIDCSFSMNFFKKTK